MLSEDLRRNPPAPDIPKLREAILGEGFTICRGVVSADQIEQLRAFWLQRYASQLAPSPIIWGPHLGEENRVLFHQSSDCCMFRSYDFLWNTPIDALTREVGMNLSRLRNDIAGVDRHAGEFMEADRYGVYITTSYYPPGVGWLKAHEDKADERRHWHFMLLLTFKGQDYATGGLHVRNRAGDRIDVDAMVEPGDVVFFDGSLTHDVETIEPIDEGGLGRLQLFSIPTFMERPQDSDRLLQNVPLGAYLRARLRPLKYRIFGEAKY